VSAVDALLERTGVYRLWQAPFAAGKLAPVLRHNDVRAARRVLDVGCGPGTNTGYFEHAEYVGIDINPRYVAWARRRYGREFVVADVRNYELPAHSRFDFVLVNSFLHHVSADEAAGILRGVARTLAPGGSVHILDLVLPEGRSLPRWLATHDRGKFARPLEAWRELFSALFRVEVFEPYGLGLFGVPLWNMIYCRGRAKNDS
jgi:SAM-dependent methyltransferase